MEDIINKIVVNKKDAIFDRIELELNLKIEKEKSKQLELIKDIRKIEKSIKEKELYCKRKKTLFSDEYDSNSDDNSSDSNTDSESEDDSESISKKSNKNNKNKNNNSDKNDTISLCSIDSDYDIEKEIDIKFN
jgi:hypothetical protein